MSNIFGGQDLTGVSRLLWAKTGADMNATTDQALTKSGQFSTFIIDKVVITNASTSLTTAVGGVYSAAAKGGDALVPAVQAYAALTAAGLGLLATLAAIGQGVRSDSALYLSLTVAQGAPATADIRVFGWALT